MYGRWNWRGLVAYFGGFTAMIPFFSTGIYRGPVAEALGGADIAMLVGLPVSTVIYLIACRSLARSTSRRKFAWSRLRTRVSIRTPERLWLVAGTRFANYRLSLAA